MTGLDANKDVILEVAVIATNWNFEELGSWETVIHHADDVLDNMDPWCVTQHGASGLTDKVKASKTSQEQAEQQLLKFIDEHFAPEDKVLLAGNSIHMDRRFIVKHWPALDGRLHYRMLDVSAWKVVFEGKLRGERFTKPDTHRALNDIRGSIEELQFYLTKVRQ